LENKDPHVIAGLLKAFFIELPDPLFTFDLYDSFIDAAGKVSSFIKSLSYIRDKLLTSPNFTILL
jgi:hypothetical protein